MSGTMASMSLRARVAAATSFMLAGRRRGSCPGAAFSDTIGVTASGSVASAMRRARPRVPRRRKARSSAPRTGEREAGGRLAREGGLGAGAGGVGVTTFIPAFAAGFTTAGTPETSRRRFSHVRIVSGGGFPPKCFDASAAPIPGWASMYVRTSP